MHMEKKACVLSGNSAPLWLDISASRMIANLHCAREGCNAPTRLVMFTNCCFVTQNRLGRQV